MVVDQNGTIARENLQRIQNIIASDGITQKRFHEEVIAKTSFLDALRI